MENNFWKLDYAEAACVLKNLHEVEILEEVMIVEVNVFLCKFREKRFNIYYDLALGVKIKSVDKIKQEDLKRIG